MKQAAVQRIRSTLALGGPMSVNWPPAVSDRLRLRPAPGLPEQVHLSVTDRCFLPCKHCDIFRNKTKDLSTDTWMSVIDELADWLGAGSMNFVGGEPLLRKDLEQLMAHAVRRGFSVTFNSNGWLIDDRRAASIADAGVEIAYLALDGSRAETVDGTRGRDGTFARTIAAMERFEALPNPRVVVACILHAGNAHEIPELLQMLTDRGHQLVVQPLYQPFGENAHQPGWHYQSDMWPRNQEDLRAIDKALDLLADVRENDGPVCNAVEQIAAIRTYFRAPTVYNGLTCKAGHSDIAFDPTGAIRLCYFLEPIGNVKDETAISKIWDRHLAQRRRWEVSRCTRQCNLLNCNFDRQDL